MAAFLEDLIRSLVPIDGPLLTQLPPALRQTGKWLAIGTGSALLLVWNDQLVLITGAGVGVLFAAYGMRSIGWRATITDGMNLLYDLNAKLIRHQESRTNQATNCLPDYNRCLLDITDADPLKRLIGVRLLHQIIATKPAQQANIAEYFRIMLSREPDETIREALLEGLQMISQTQPLKNLDRPDRRPIQLRQTVLPPSLENAFAISAIRATEERLERESTIG